MSFTVTIGNDHVHVMGNRNTKPIDNNVVRISDDLHDLNDDIGDFVKSNRESRQVQDSVIQPNIFSTQFSSAGVIQNQCKVTFDKSIATSVIVSSCSSSMQGMHVSTMLNQPLSSDNIYFASASSNVHGVTSAMNGIEQTPRANLEKLATLQTALPASEACTEDFVANHSSVDVLMPRILYTPEHTNCLRQMEAGANASNISGVKLRDNVIGQCYAIENSSLESSIPKDSCRRNMNSCASDSPVWHKDEDKNFTVGKKYKITKEDGKVVEGVFDGRYIVVADQSCTKRPAASLSTQTCETTGTSKSSAQSSMETKSEGMQGDNSNCRIKLDRLPSGCKRIKLQSNEDLQPQDSSSNARGLDKSAFYGSKTVSSKDGSRQRRNLKHLVLIQLDEEDLGHDKQSAQVSPTVIQIDLDDDEDTEDVENASISFPAPFELSNSDDNTLSENEDCSEVLMEINVNTATFRGKCYELFKAVFFPQKIELRTGSKSSTLRVRDVSSIKCNLSTSPDIMSSVNIYVLPTFKDTFLAPNTKPGTVDELILFFEIKPNDIDMVNTAVQILNSLLPETNETPLDDECQQAKLCKSIHVTTSSGLQALQEYNNDDDASDIADDEQLPELKPSEAIVVSNYFSAEIVKLFIYPPPPAVGGITVTNEDLFCLNDEEFLNDVIIEFYIKYLQTEILTPYQLSRTHIFNTFFYGQLTKGGKEASNGLSVQERRHSQVKRWTKHVDLFSKDFIIVPINEDAHWFLAIICFPYLAGTKQSLKTPVTKNSTPSRKSFGCQSPQAELSAETLSEDEKYPCILIFDSLKGGSNRWTVAINLRDYLQIEWNLKKAPEEGPRRFDKSSFKGATPNSPQQMNSSDCGIYLLHYIENFFKRPLTSYALPIRYLHEWFPSSEIATKRRAIRNLIVRLSHQLNPSLAYDPANDGCDIK